MLQPAVQTNVTATITKHRMRGKAYYDRTAQHLPALNTGQTVRVQTACGFDWVAKVQGPALQPNSYTITSQGATYIRNRRHLLCVDEPTQTITEEDMPLMPFSAPSDPNTDHDDAPPPTPPRATQVVSTGDSSGRRPVVTRAGRVSQPSQRYQDYVTE